MKPRCFWSISNGKARDGSSLRFSSNRDFADAAVARAQKVDCMNSEAQPGETEVNHAFHVSKQTWTHIALHCKNIDEMIAWYKDTSLPCFSKRKILSGGSVVEVINLGGATFCLAFQQFAEVMTSFTRRASSTGSFCSHWNRSPHKEEVDDTCESRGLWMSDYGACQNAKTHRLYLFCVTQR